jgi:arginyl-tRNA--protein-N-Asp/Glu arginylyltransferase
LGFSLQSFPFRKSGNTSRRPLPSCHSCLALSMASCAV